MVFETRKNTLNNFLSHKYAHNYIDKHMNMCKLKNINTNIR